MICNEMKDSLKIGKLMDNPAFVLDLVQMCDCPKSGNVRRFIPLKI